MFNKISQNSTLIGASVKFEGEFRGQENIFIEGIIKGLIETEGDIGIEKSARVKANLRGKNVIIGGKVEGYIEAKEMIKILDTGEMRGDIKAKFLDIAPGAKLLGGCNMERKGEKSVLKTRVSEVVKEEKNIS